MAKLPDSIFPATPTITAFGFLTRDAAPDDDADALCDRVHRRMAQELKQLDAGTIWEIKSPEP